MRKNLTCVYNEVLSTAGLRMRIPSINNAKEGSSMFRTSLVKARVAGDNLMSNI